MVKKPPSFILLYIEMRWLSTRYSQSKSSGEILSTALLHLIKRHGMHKLKAKYAALCLVARLSCMLQLVISVVH